MQSSRFLTNVTSSTVGTDFGTVLIFFHLLIYSPYVALCSLVPRVMVSVVTIETKLSNPQGFM